MNENIDTYVYWIEYGAVDMVENNSLSQGFDPDAYKLLVSLQFKSENSLQRHLYA